MIQSQETRRVLLWSALAALVATLINCPLTRFPIQDFLWNDLVLLARTSWARSALLTNPLASIDFLQGLGSNFRYDVKLMPHFFDPAVFFSLFTGTYHALWLRTLALNIYCLASLWTLLRQQAEQENRPVTRLWPFLLLAYVLTPQLHCEVAHHFSTFYLALPGVVVAARSFVRSPRFPSALGLVAALTLLVHLSDVHIFLLAEIIALFLLIFDPILSKHRKRFTVVALAFYTVLLASCMGAFQFVSGTSEMVISRGTWGLREYLDRFVTPISWSLLFPSCPGPVSGYIGPYVPIFALMLLSSRGRSALGRRFALLFALGCALFLMGISFHSIDFIRSRLPSSMRYHITLIPFLSCLWILFHAGTVEEALDDWLKQSWKLRALGAFALVAIFLVAAIHVIPRNSSFVAWGDLSLQLPAFRPRVQAILIAALYPGMFLCLALFRKYLSPLNAKGFALASFALISLSVASYGVRALLQGEIFTDGQLYRTLYTEMPARIEQVIAQSPYSKFPRSIMPIAVSFNNSDRGYNDKLLPLIEFPEMLSARAFFNWRYSYTSHTSGIYSAVAEASPICILPPTPRHAPAAIDFALSSESPFIVSADALLSDPRLDLIGQFDVGNTHISRYPHIANGLTGRVYVYAIRTFVSKFESINFERTSVTFIGPREAADRIRLPISYIPGMVAMDQEGGRLELSKGDDGYARVEKRGPLKEIRVTSRSWFSLLDLISPLLGLLPLASYLLYLKRFRVGERWQQPYAGLPTYGRA